MQANSIRTRGRGSEPEDTRVDEDECDDAIPAEKTPGYPVNDMDRIFAMRVRALNAVAWSGNDTEGPSEAIASTSDPDG